MIDVLDKITRRIETARAEVDRQHHLGVGRLAPVGEFMHADLIALRGVPVEIEPDRPLLLGADAVFPVIGGDEIAARVAHHRDIELLDQPDDVLAHAIGVGGLVVGLIDAGIDGAAEMLEEGAIDAIIDFGNGIVLVRRDVGLHPPLHSILIF